MATTHRDALTCAWLLAGVSGLLQHANVHAQERTHSVTPLIGVKLEHTDNVDGVSDGSGQDPRSENILTLSPALIFQHRGPSNTLDGRFGVLVEKRLQNTSSDRILPDGLLRWRSELREQGLGLDASLLAQQVKPVISSVGSTSDSTNTSATETRASISPFLERRLSERNSLIGRLNGSLQRTDPREDLQRSTRTRSSGAQLAWVTRPAPFGYSLEASTLNENARYETPAQSSSVAAITERGETRQRTLRATLLYAWHEELELGLIAGTEKDERVASLDTAGLRLRTERRFDGPFGGLLATWRPTPRTTLSGQFESREAGRNWNTELSHRLRRTTFALTGSQTTSRNAPTLLTGRSAPTTTAPNPDTGGILTGAPTTAIRGEVASAALSVQRDLAMRVTYEGVRSTLSLASGRFQSRALLSTTTSAPGTERSRYNAGTISYRLTPEVSPVAGLRWSRAQDTAGLSRREWLMSLGVNILLSPRTTLEGGLSLLRSTATSASRPDGDHTTIHSANIRLEHRF